MADPGTIRTARVSYSGPDRLDVTRKGGSPFGPSRTLLDPYLAKRKAGTLTDADWAAYRAAYTDEMRVLWRRDRASWRVLIDVACTQGVVLVCYCTDPARCHRTVLAELLVTAATRLGVDLTYTGEVTP